MKYSHWILPDEPPASARLLEASGIPALLSLVLAARGCETPKQAQALLYSSAPLLDPFLMRDMDAAVSLISRAIAQGDPIAVYGDYDVDGITAVCLLTSFLEGLGAAVQYHIPNRLQDGYGLNRDSISALARAGVKLIVTVDCGITAIEETAHAKALGLTVVITDHHTCKEQLPPADAIVDPHRPDCSYPFSGLAGVGVALKLALALTPPDGRQAVFLRYADLAAIGTVADVVPLTGENRTIVKTGLACIPNSLQPGLRILLRESGLDRKRLNSFSIGYAIAPRINAAGRMGNAQLAAALLLTKDSRKAQDLVGLLCALNRERQNTELDIYRQCLSELGEGVYRSIVLAGENWHQGVLGIVASRLTEKYGCPSFIISLENGLGKGSCRTPPSFNLFHALEQCSHLLHSYGGHDQAAGFTIAQEQIPAFRREMERIIQQSEGVAAAAARLEVDCQITDPGLLSRAQVEGLACLEPFGAGNPQPVVFLSGVVLSSLSAVGSGRHTRLRLLWKNAGFDGILFGLSPQELGMRPTDRADVVCSPQINEFHGKRGVQLLIHDIRPSLSHAQADRLLYARYCQGQPLTPAEAASLLPRREDFVRLWRFLQSVRRGQRIEETAPRMCRRLSRSTGVPQTCARMMICLEVFQELGLLSLCTQTDHLRIDLLPAAGKADLEQSLILQRLRRQAEP